MIRSTISDKPELLEIMLADMEEQDGVYQPGPYWQEYGKRIAEAAASEGLASFRSSPGIAKGYADVFNDHSVALMNPGWKRSLFCQFEKSPLTRTFLRRRSHRIANRNRKAHRQKDLRYQNVLEDWIQDFVKEYAIPDTRVGDPQRTISFSCGETGELYLRNFAWISEYSKYVDFKSIRAVFEIGGGFGAMAHTLLHMFPNIEKYLYLDIPPNLYVGTQYLKYFFGNSVIDYSATRNQDKIRFSSGNEREILAICPWQIEKVDVSTDLFWNSSSFQEMPEDTVRNYARHMNRVLGEGSTLCLFVYDTKDPDRTLRASQVLDTVRNQTNRDFEEIDTSIIDHIVPGVCLLGRNQS